MDTLQDLKKMRLLTHLPEHVLCQMAQAAIPLHCEDGQMIDLDDEQGAVFFVVKGMVRSYRSNRSGREQNLIHLTSGDAFNIPQAFSGQDIIPISAVAIGDVYLLKIPFDPFQHIVSCNPEAALAVLQDLSKKLAHLTQLTHDLSLRTVRARLARFLLDQSRASVPSGVQWTQHEIAAQIGSVREVVSRTMRAFVRDGLIRLNRQRIEILDEKALEAEAEKE
ncbi:MAG: Crp/Fnr family transcriptional regulator [Anaerolineaceae bacterium]|jgi:CRP/FNR family transcriptional regulator|nr:Crp/Fnr family transcriptional regulator [Anaerolineaceae bacterium]